MEAFGDAVAVGEDEHAQDLLLPCLQGFAEGSEQIEAAGLHLFDDLQEVPMSWNYRVVRTTHNNQENSVTWGIHEAFYDAAGTAKSITERPVPLDGDSPDELFASLARMLLAFRRTALCFDEASGELGELEILDEILASANAPLFEAVDEPAALDDEAEDNATLVRLLEDAYSLPGRAAGPLSTCLQWHVLKNRLGLKDGMDDNVALPAAEADLLLSRLNDVAAAEKNRARLVDSLARHIVGTGNAHDWQSECATLAGLGASFKDLAAAAMRISKSSTGE